MLTGSAGLLVIGFVVGGIGTIIGSGGGFLLVPSLLLLDPHISPDVAAGTSLAVVFFNATSGSIAYARMRRVNFQAGTIFAIAAIPGAIIGAYTTSHIPRHVFDAMFGFLLIAASVYLARTSGKKIGKPSSGDFNLWLGVAISVGV